MLCAKWFDPGLMDTSYRIMRTLKGVHQTGALIVKIGIVKKLTQLVFLRSSVVIQCKNGTVVLRSG